MQFNVASQGDTIVETSSATVPTTLGGLCSVHNEHYIFSPIVLIWFLFLCWSVKLSFFNVLFTLGHVSSNDSGKWRRIKLTLHTCDSLHSVFVRAFLEHLFIVVFSSLVLKLFSIVVVEACFQQQFCCVTTHAFIQLLVFSSGFVHFLSSPAVFIFDEENIFILLMNNPSSMRSTKRKSDNSLLPCSLYTFASVFFVFTTKSPGFIAFSQTLCYPQWTLNTNLEKWKLMQSSSENASFSFK